MRTLARLWLHDCTALAIIHTYVVTAAMAVAVAVEVAVAAAMLSTRYILAIRQQVHCIALLFGVAASVCHFI